MEEGISGIRLECCIMPSWWKWNNIIMVPVVDTDRVFYLYILGIMDTLYALLIAD